MPGLDPGIHENRYGRPLCVDGRIKPGHDDVYRLFESEH
jgi:hypothetical protein